MLDVLQTAAAYLLPFLIVLTVVVTVHELGHFLAARACGVKVDRFSIGFGKAILKFKDKHGVDWRLGWLPLGGYVRFAGDESSASVPDHEDLKHLRAEVLAREGPEALKGYFHFKPVWQRAIVVAAGPFANFVLSTALFAVLLMWIGQTLSPMRVDQIAPGSAAERAGFQVGDVVTAVDGRKVDSFESFKQYVAVRGGAEITFTLKRGDRTVVLNGTPDKKIVTDELGVPAEMGVLGLVNQRRAEDVTRQRLGPVQALIGGAERTWDVLETTVVYLGRMIRGEVSSDQIGGPLRIGHTAGGVAQMAADSGVTLNEKALAILVSLMGLTAVLSVGIGFMNLLPVPVLDGGHLLFYAYEAVARRPVAARVQEAGYRLGLALLLGLMLFATWNDFQNLRVFQLLGGLVS
jgi:regulator of sigma E protease